MNNLFRKLSLNKKLLLLILIPIVLIIKLAIGIFNEKSKNLQLLRGYIERINESADISDLITALQTERRYSYVYALRKDIDSRAEMEIQRPVTDLAIKKLSKKKDSSLKDFQEYTFLKDLSAIRLAIDSGTSQEVVMQYYTTTIFRINTLNIIVPVGTNRYLQPVFNDLTSQKILSEMLTYFGIIRSNFYNVLYTKKNMVGTLYGLQGVYSIYKSYETEFFTKASPSAVNKYKEITGDTATAKTFNYVNKVFSKFTFDSLYNADEWWNMSEKSVNHLQGLEIDLMRQVQSGMNKVYKDELFSRDLAIAIFSIAIIIVFGVMFYTTRIITQMLKELNEAAQKISTGVTGVKIKTLSPDVMGSLGESILKIDNNNKQLAEAADSIGKGNFNVPLSPRSEEDVLGNAIIKMKENLRQFTTEIKKNQEQFRQVADSAPVMIWMTDENKQCNFVNKGWLRFTGRRKEQEMGYGWIEGIHPDDYSRCAEIFENAFEERKRYSLEYRFKRADGEYRWLTETGTPVYSVEGKFEGYIGTCIDIHEMKMHEQRRDDFIKMASHELKTPVTSIKGYVQLLLAMFDDYNKNQQNVSPQAIRTSLTTIDKQIIKLNRLMSELLDLSRIDSDRLELNTQKFNLDKLVIEIVNDAQQITKHAIIIKNHSNCNVVADRDRIGQVLLNILTNAIKYSAPETTIEVNIYQPGQDLVAVSVADHGIGIDKKDQEKIFERFYRAEGKSEQTYPGFGIGLFIASEIMHRHNGTISVQSEKGKGSVFIFILPVS
jgi:PAS domain S-box-containing protein